MHKVPAMDFVKRMFSVLLLLASSVVVAQTEQPSTTEIPDDTNPTKAVLFSLREEHYNFLGNSWNNLVILRGDHALLKPSRLKPKGIIKLSPSCHSGIVTTAHLSTRRGVFSSRHENCGNGRERVFNDGNNELRCLR